MLILLTNNFRTDVPVERLYLTFVQTRFIASLQLLTTNYYPITLNF
ncbi:hypothetical protein NIES4075_48330 [Tolypothrix sp. NIES-4075]|nr:hypothetical protein NIES4075_48330 [Tolypothrix sp. NIES-4075]